MGDILGTILFEFRKISEVGFRFRRQNGQVPSVETRSKYLYINNRENSPTWSYFL